jgi:hypothetical protein
MYSRRVQTNIARIVILIIFHILQMFRVKSVPRVMLYRRSNARLSTELQTFTGVQWSAFLKANFNAFAIFGAVISAVAVVVSYQNAIKADIKMLENNAQKDKEMFLSIARKDKEMLLSIAQKDKEIMEKSAELSALKNTLLFGQSEEYKAMSAHAASQHQTRHLRR